MSKKERKELRRHHRREHERRYADRLKSILLLDAGWTLEEISAALLLDESTVRRYRQWYEEGGIESLLTNRSHGSERRLSPVQELELLQHLQTHLYSRTCEIAEYVKRAYGVLYTPRGMRHVLTRLGFVYKKTRAVPGKANAKKQEEFVALYHELMENKAEEDPVYFVDGVHPQHNLQPAYGWILKGKEHQVPTNTGRKRVNLNGALKAETHEVVIREDESINAQSTMALFNSLERCHQEANVIYVILDNAPYYRSRLLRKFVRGSKIQLLFLPPYAPNLNLIERLWRFFKKKVLANRYFANFLDFRKACLGFFRRLQKYDSELDSLLRDNFQIIRPAV